MQPPPSDASAWGIDSHYVDVDGRRHEVASATVAAVLQALGAGSTTDSQGRVTAAEPPNNGDDAVWVVHPGEPVDAGGPYRIRAEDGQDITGSGALPGDLPLGYHDLSLMNAAQPVRVIVSPGSCNDAVRGWGWSVQLYAALSSQSWGIGDLRDLGALAKWARDAAAAAVMVSPLHGVAPSTPQQASPYDPASRVFRNPLYLHIPTVDGADGLPGLDAAVEAGRELNGHPLIDRDAVWELKRGVLEQAFERWQERPPIGSRSAFAAYRAEQGDVIDSWAAWCVACDMAGADRATWPDSMRPDTLVPAVRADPELARRARFHAWLQWQLDRQLAAAADEGVSLITDLAVGSNGGGFDTWFWADAFAHELHVGAPPDAFAAEGQDWGFPPFDPWALRRLAFDPFVRVVRAGLRHAGGIRMDHVMSLFRLFVVPVGARPTDGCYLRYPSSELLDVLALEAHRAGAFVIGEDLGNVEPTVRDELSRRNILGTKLFLFEQTPPSEWPPSTLGAITTHDLPTVAGAWSGRDPDDQDDAGDPSTDGAVAAFAAKLAIAAGIDRSASAEEAADAAHRLLASARSDLVLVTLEDATGQVRRPNLPGTTCDERPNWSIPLPIDLDDLPRHEGAQSVIEVMRHRSNDASLHPTA